MQIIACAGSGKTETLTARIVKLLHSGVAPSSIVAFTFTVRAAEELLNRIRRRLGESLDSQGDLRPVYSTLAQLKCSTMHSFCFELLRQIDPRYRAYEVFSEPQEYALLLRSGVSIGLSGGQNSLRFVNDIGQACPDDIEAWLASLDVVHNELLDENLLYEATPHFYQVYQQYRALLDRQRIITFGLIVSETVQHLRPLPVERHPLAGVKYLFVDEYQDTNAAQECLIEEFQRIGAEICVVGDDDQCIYEWRGSNVENFLGYEPKYSATPYDLPENRRCQQMVFDVASSVAATIRQRREKAMTCVSDQPPALVTIHAADSPAREGEFIASEILRLTDGAKQHQYGFCEIAVLLRSIRTSAPPILAALDEAGIPYRVVGTASVLQRPGVYTCVLLVYAWAETIGRGPKRPDGASWAMSFRASLEQFACEYGVDQGRLIGRNDRFIEMGADLAKQRRPDVVKAAQEVFEGLELYSLNPSEGGSSGLLSDCATFTNLLSDVQAAFLRNLAREGYGSGADLINDIAWFLKRYALSRYEAQDCLDPGSVDAVTVSTVHQAKGLEWPVVFIPALVKKRFPTRGQDTFRFIPDQLYPRERYDAKFAEDEDPERRLFYVAVTRARERLYLTRFARIKRAAEPSVFFDAVPERCTGDTPVPGDRRPAPRKAKVSDVPCTHLLEYLRCPHYYRFRRLWNWRVELPEELGVAVTLHHIVSVLAERAVEGHDIEQELEAIVDREFHLPYAPPFVQSALKSKAVESVARFHKRFGPLLANVSLTEAEIVFPLGDSRIHGRPDLLFAAGPDACWIVDLKNIRHFEPSQVDARQIQAYAIAVRFAGEEPSRGSFYNFADDSITDVPLGEAELEEAEEDLRGALEGVSQRVLEGRPSKACPNCDYAHLCCYCHDVRSAE